MKPSDRAQGFTLLEMLVVMLIAGMALALTSQALGQYQRAQTSAIASERAGREYRLSESWFRDSVRGLYPAASETDLSRRSTTALGADADVIVFEGDRDGFTGVTLVPVLAGQGVPTRQAWHIERQGDGSDHLTLEERGATLPLSLPRSVDLQLHYLDPEGKLHDDWPPRLGTWKQLPEAVVLEMTPAASGSGHGMVIVSSVIGPRDPLKPYENAYEDSFE